MDRRASMEVMNRAGWRRTGGTSQPRGRRQHWSPVCVRQKQQAGRQWQNRVGGRVTRGTSKNPLHTRAEDYRRSLEFPEMDGLVRPASSASGVGESSDGREWDEKLWRWRSVRPASRGSSAGFGGMSALPQTPAPAPARRPSSRGSAATPGGAAASDSERQIDGIRASVTQLQQELSTDMVAEAFSRLRKKLVSRFAAQQAFVRAHRPSALLLTQPRTPRTSHGRHALRPAVSP